MQRSIYYLAVYLLSISILATTGCKKKNKSDSDVTFVNQTDNLLTLDIYASFDDYANNRSLFKRSTIKAQDRLIIPGDDFSSGRTYYMDWYSEDYYHSNWYNDDYAINSSRVAFTPRIADNTYYIEETHKGNGRRAFIKGNGTESNWLAVGAYLFSSNTGYSNQWTTLDNNERFRQITVKKGFNAVYKFKDKSGTDQSQELQFLVHQTDVPYIEFKGTDASILGNMTGGKLPTGTPPDYKSNAIDTVMALFPNSDYIFMMVRQ
ncbi:MAG: hypothetical protein H6551_08185 [Chitinophagales bacterium]|nr:hypothetical protein [Chitinophagaceae bacterium]MCB9065101.1 hypothetical protein [Chitinophagales bacterium]